MRDRSARSVHLTLTTVAVALVLLLGGDTTSSQSNSAAQGPRRPRVSKALLDRAARDGRVRVLVELNVPGGHFPEGRLSNLARLDQRGRLTAQRSRVLSRLSPAGYRVVHPYQTIPWVALDA